MKTLNDNPWTLCLNPWTFCAIGWVALALTGCAPTLERSRVEGAQDRAAAAATPAEDCHALSRTERALRYVAVGTAAASGAAGLTTIETDDRTADQALAVTAAGLAVGAVVAEAVRSQVAADFVKDCQ